LLITQDFEACQVVQAKLDELRLRRDLLTQHVHGQETKVGDVMSHSSSFSDLLNGNIPGGNPGGNPNIPGAGNKKVSKKNNNPYGARSPPTINQVTNVATLSKGKQDMVNLLGNMKAVVKQTRNERNEAYKKREERDQDRYNAGDFKDTNSGSTAREFSDLAVQARQYLFKSKASLKLAKDMLVAGASDKQKAMGLAADAAEYALPEYAGTTLPTVKKQLRQSRRELELALKGQYQTGLERLIGRCKAVGKTPKKQAAYGVLVTLLGTAVYGSKQEMDSTVEYVFKGMVAAGVLAAGIVTISFIQLHILTDRTEKKVNTFKDDPNQLVAQNEDILHPEYIKKRSFLSPMWQSVLLAFASAMQLACVMAIAQGKESNPDWSVAGGSVFTGLAAVGTRVFAAWQAPGAKEMNPMDGAKTIQGMLDQFKGIKIDEFQGQDGAGPQNAASSDDSDDDDDVVAGLHGVIPNNLGGANQQQAPATGMGHTPLHRRSATAPNQNQVPQNDPTSGRSQTVGKDQIAYYKDKYGEYVPYIQQAVPYIQQAGAVLQQRTGYQPNLDRLYKHV